MKYLPSIINFIEPSIDSFTIYTKSGCVNCSKMKKILSTAIPKPLIIDCDEYLIEHRDEFLEIMKKYTKTDKIIFPIIFENGIYIKINL